MDSSGARPLEGRAVAHGGGHRDDRRRGEPGDDAGEGAVHPGHDDDRGRPVDELPAGQDPVQARHSHVHDELDRAAEVPGREHGLLRDGQVRGAGAEHGDETPGRRRRIGWPGEEAGSLVVSGVGQRGQDCRRVVGVRAGEQHRPRVCPVSWASRRRRAIAPTWSAVLPSQ